MPNLTGIGAPRLIEVPHRTEATADSAAGRAPQAGDPGKLPTSRSFDRERLPGASGREGRQRHHTGNGVPYGGNGGAGNAG